MSPIPSTTIMGVCSAVVTRLPFHRLPCVPVCDAPEEELLCMRLQKEMRFGLDLAQRVLHTPDLGQELIRLYDEGVQLSEDDPLVCLLLERPDEVCLHYMNCGNYGLPPNVPGSMPWPGGAPPAVGKLSIQSLCAPPTACWML